jgi:hypothetical protein
MQDPVEEAHRENIQRMVLGLLYKKWREGLLSDDIAAPPDFRDLYRTTFNETRTDAKLREIFRQTLSDLRYSGFLGVESLQAGQAVLRIRPNGIRELGRLNPGISVGELGTMGRTLLEQDADLQETIEDTKAEEARLAQSLGTFEARILALRDQVDRSVNDVDTKLVQMQKDLYNQVFVLMTVLVAAFALIFTGAQVVQGVMRSSEAGWWEIALDASAIMIPVATLSDCRFKRPRSADPDNPRRVSGVTPASEL